MPIGHVVGRRCGCLRCPAKPKQANGDKKRSCDSGRQTKFRFRAARFSALLFTLIDQVKVILVPPITLNIQPSTHASNQSKGRGRDKHPPRIRSHPSEHSTQEAHKCETYLPWLKAMIVLEYDLKGSEEEIYHTQDQCREDAKVQAHGLQG